MDTRPKSINNPNSTHIQNEINPKLYSMISNSTSVYYCIQVILNPSVQEIKCAWQFREPTSAFNLLLNFFLPSFLLFSGVYSLLKSLLMTFPIFQSQTATYLPRLYQFRAHEELPICCPQPTLPAIHMLCGGCHLSMYSILSCLRLLEKVRCLMIYWFCGLFDVFWLFSYALECTMIEWIQP